MTKEPTCEVVGEELRTCLICDTFTQTNYIPKLNHTYISTETDTHWIKECVCGDRQEFEKENAHTVSFFGDNIDIPKQIVAHGSTFSLPTPVRDGFVFAEFGKGCC